MIWSQIRLNAIGLAPLLVLQTLAIKLFDDTITVIVLQLLGILLGAVCMLLWYKVECKIMDRKFEKERGIDNTSKHML